MTFARERPLATGCALIGMAIAIAVAAKFIEPLLKKHDTLLTDLLRLFN